MGNTFVLASTPRKSVYHYEVFSIFYLHSLATLVSCSKGIALQGKDGIGAPPTFGSSNYKGLVLHLSNKPFTQNIEFNIEHLRLNKH